MPRFFYLGDPRAIKKEAINLVMTGEIGIRYDKREELSDLVNDRPTVQGLYFIENDVKKRLFSKWGISNTLLFALPALFLDAKTLDINEEQILYHNYLNIALSVLIALYLFAASGLFTRSSPARVVFVLSSLYATYLWHYLRMQTYEIFHVLLSIGFFYHYVRYLRSYRAADTPAGKRTHFLLWNGLLIILVLSKVTFFVFYFAVAATALLFYEHPIVAGKREKIRRLAFDSVIPFLICLAVFTTVNYFKFSKFYLLGYHYVDGAEKTWSFSYFIPKLGELFISPYKNLFVHYPLLLFAMFGLVAFFRKYRLEYGWVLIVFATSTAIMSCYRTFGGPYGPRLLVSFMPLVTLPCTAVLEGVFRKPKEGKRGRQSRRSDALPPRKVQELLLGKPLV